MSRVLNRVREVVLTVGAVGGLLCIALAIGTVAFGLRPLIVQSGSMAPTIQTGALLIARDTAVAKLHVGDVVTVKRRDHTLVTHRIVRITPQGNHSTLTLKGDANKVPDPELYTVKRAGVKLVAIPFAGRVAAAMASPIGIFLLGIYVAFLIAVVANDWRNRNRPKKTKGGGRRSSRKKSRDAVAAGCGVLMFGTALVVPIAPKPTFAAWTDSVSVGTSTLTAYAVPKPVWVSCTVTGGALSQKTATIVWNEVSSPYALDYTATIQETGQSISVTDNGSTRQVQFSAGLLSTVLNQAYHIVVVAKLPSPNGSWVSPSMTQQVTITTLGLGMTCDSHT